MRLLLACLLMAAMVACQNSPNNVSNASKTVDTTTCFLSALNQDSVILLLRDSMGVLSGKLDYLPYEKDGTIGDLYNLTYKGDTLFGTYKSMQEGQETVGEIALLKRGNTFILTNDIWGGDNYQYDSAYTNGKFINKSKIAFTGDTLKAWNCK